jgi:hypothetical protein
LFFPAKNRKLRLSNRVLLIHSPCNQVGVSLRPDSIFAIKRWLEAVRGAITHRFQVFSSKSETHQNQICRVFLLVPGDWHKN